MPNARTSAFIRGEGSRHETQNAGLRRFAAAYFRAESIGLGSCLECLFMACGSGL